MNNSNECIRTQHNDTSHTLNPIAILQWLKTKENLAPPYYLHIHHGSIEIGWEAKAKLTCLNGEQAETQNWVDSLKSLCDEAASDNNKAFGYLGFDSCYCMQGMSPDKSAHFPLLQFFIPKHRISIKNNTLEYKGTNCHLLDDMAEMSVSQSDFKLPRLSPCVEFSEEDFMSRVALASQHLSNHLDLNKVVLSRYLGFDYDGDLLPLFNAYCLQQKYCDAILMDFGEVSAAIASPELLLQTAEGIVTTKPLAGTRAAGKSDSENRQIEKSLLFDRKELTEHVLGLAEMLAELQPCCETDTLVIKNFLNILYQNNLMHLSSELKGYQKSDGHCIDAMLALFPSVMVSGVSKVEAIRYIRNAEPFSRGLFAGTAGWASGQDCRFSVIIRSFCKYGKRLFVQAGAGILAESDPVQENQEVNLKMSEMLARLGYVNNE
ncbi:anthranilate synthase subunit I [Candidatus Magnetomorum sp. HK-1]|nr:anthranilate synthase subunit I [Candidatus Magnetomorum sp. HK-1]